MKNPILPETTADLIKFLDKQYPAKCIEPRQSLEDAHRYAGKRELVEYLKLKFKESNEDGLALLMES